MSTRQVESARRRGLRARRGAALIGALAVLAVFGAAQASAAKLPRLHVSGQKVRDSHGRQVLLRGVNDTSLTDQYVVNPRLPTVIPLTKSDYEGMESFGFNVLRLGVSWSALEPERGRIDDDYIRQIADVVRKAADHGMYTVINMHNAGWGKYPASTPQTKCPEGLRPSHGWHGAPKWATFPGDNTTCHDDKTYKRTPAVRAAWTKFWKNYKPRSWGKHARGIQQHLVGVWGALASAFARNRAVAGYDLLNEADPGYVRRRKLSKRTSAFDRRAIGSIRRSEKSARGFSHMVFFEPDLTWSEHGIASRSPRPGFSHDRNLVYAPHLYGLDVHTNDRAVRSVRRTLKRQAKQVVRMASRYRSPVWIGEWSFSQFDKDSMKKLLAHIRIQDSMQLGSAWWQWRVACGGPQAFDGLDPTPSHRILGTINPVKCPRGEPVPRPKRWKGIIARAYPRASPGHLTSLRSRGQRMRLTGTSKCNRRFARRRPKACRLEVWIPNKQRPKVKGLHVRHIRVHRQRGGWVATATVRGRYELRTR